MCNLSYGGKLGIGGGVSWELGGGGVSWEFGGGTCNAVEHKNESSNHFRF